MTTQTTGHHQYSMQDQTPSSKWWKWMAPLTMMALPTIFEMNFVEVWQSLQILKFFLIRRGVPRAVLMRLNAIASFSLWWHKWNNFSSSSTSSRTNSVQGTYPGIMHEPCQSLQFCMNFNHLGVVLIPYYKGMHLIIHFNPGVSISLHLFPFSDVQHSHRDVCCQQQHRCLTAIQ